MLTHPSREHFPRFTSRNLRLSLRTCEKEKSVCFRATFSSYRFITQTTGSTTGHQGGGGGLRSVLDQFTDYQLAQQLARNGRGNAYRYRKKLWPATEALEAAITAAAYPHTAERVPYPLLPQFTCDAYGFLSSASGENRTLSLSSSVSSGIGALQKASASSNPSPYLPCRSPSASSSSSPFSIHDKILRVDDLEGTPLSSVVPSREIAHSVSPAASTGLASGEPATASAPAGLSWSATGLDPILAETITLYTSSPTPTHLQSRLIPALLREDHQDVIFNAPKGSGSTTALVLATLQGVRSESAGVNILVAKDSTSAMRMYDLVLALIRRSGDPGGKFLGDVNGGGNAGMAREEEEEVTASRPPSWLYYCTFREHYTRCEAQFQRSLQHPDGPIRLFITTADVLCELLFEKKMEFERFGYLRRVYVDDVAEQIPMLSETAAVSEVKERLRNPLAAELLLGTLHQLPGPHIRSILQLGLVSSNLTVPLKKHLLALCVKPTSHYVCLSPVRLSTTIQCLFSTFAPALSSSDNGRTNSVGNPMHGVHFMKNSHERHPSSGIRSGVLSTSSPSLPLLSSTSHASCSSSMTLWWSSPSLQVLRQTLLFAAALLWKAKHHIPGRVLFFVEDKTDVLRARQALRAAGLDVKLLSEVLRPQEEDTGTKTFAFSTQSWRFLLLHQKDSILLRRVAIPFVSHAMICFPPTSWQGYLEMATTVSNSAAWTRNVGWVWVVTPARDAKQVREVVECLDVDFVNHHVDENLAPVPAEIVERRTRAPTLYGLDPQFAVQQHYEMQAENPDVSYRRREFFTPGRNKNKGFQMEDYTPMTTQMQSFNNAKKLARDVERNPGEVVRRLQKNGFMTPSLKPTYRLRNALKQKAPK